MIPPNPDHCAGWRFGLLTEKEKTGMSQQRKRTLQPAVLSVVLGITLVAGAADAAQKVRFMTQEWEPYNFTKDGQPVGVSVATVKCIAAKIGVDAEIVIRPWVRAQAMVKDGEADAFFAASESPERNQFAVISKPISPQVWGWYMPKGSSKDPSSPADLKVGVVIGSAMEKFLTEKGYTVSQKLNATTPLVKLLESGRVDAVLANTLVFEEAMADAKVEKDAFQLKEHSNRPLGVYFSKTFIDANPGFLDKFNAAIPGCGGA